MECITNGSRRRSIGILLTFFAVFLAIPPHSAMAQNEAQTTVSQPPPVRPKTSSMMQHGEINPAAISYEGCGGVRVGVIDAEFEQQVIELTNQERAAQGLAPLAYNEDLAHAARYHAVDMAQDDYFEHNSFDRNGDTLVEACPWYERLRAYYPGASIGENIAWNYRSPADVVAAWMNSDGHRANILGDYREIGVGFYNWYADQNFGTRANVYPVVINGEAAATASTEITLYVYGQWDDVRLRNDDGAWTDWRSFTNELSWNLPAVPGSHTVSLEMRNGATTLTSSDTIEYIGPAQAPELPPTATSTPTPLPTPVPTATELPTATPTDVPSATPTEVPTQWPTAIPTATQGPTDPAPVPVETETPVGAETTDLSLLAASYLGGEGQDTIAAIDIAPDGAILVAGTFTGFKATAASVAAVSLLPNSTASDARGGVLRLTDQGTRLYSATLIGTEVTDMEIAENGMVAVCGDFGVALLGHKAASLEWFANPGAIERCAVGVDGTVATFAGDRIHLYTAEGEVLSTWRIRDAILQDLAVFDRDGIVAVTGYRQSQPATSTAFLHGWNYQGDVVWRSYDHEETDGLDAETQGKRVARGRDGRLYLAATVKGGTNESIFARDPQNVYADAADRIRTFDEYNTATDVNDATITWYGRYAADSGNLLVGQSVLTRRPNGRGNSVIPYGIAADRDGRLYLSGSAWAAIAGRDDRRLDGEPVGDYEAGEPFVLVVAPDFRQRLVWSTFAQQDHQAGDSPATSVAVRDGLAAVAVSAQTDSGRRLHTASSALQEEPSGASDGYMAAWAQVDSESGSETAGQAKDESNLVFLPLVVNR